MLGIGDKNESVVGYLERDRGFEQLAGEPGVAIAEGLQPERSPGRHAQLAQTELLVDEVEIVKGGIHLSAVTPTGCGLATDVQGKCH